MQDLISERMEVFYMVLLCACTATAGVVINLGTVHMYTHVL